MMEILVLTFMASGCVRSNAKNKLQSNPKFFHFVIYFIMPTTLYVGYTDLGRKDK